MHFLLYFPDIRREEDNIDIIYDCYITYYTLLYISNIFTSILNIIIKYTQLLVTHKIKYKKRGLFTPYTYDTLVTSQQKKRRKKGDNKRLEKTHTPPRRSSHCTSSHAARPAKPRGKKTTPRTTTTRCLSPPHDARIERRLSWGRLAWQQRRCIITDSDKKRGEGGGGGKRWAA